MALRIEARSGSHRALIADFQDQRASLVEYLKRFALRHAEKDMLARTYLAIDDVSGGTRLGGYFSLSVVSVERATVTALPELDRLPRFPIPGVLLARLAVDARVQGRGLADISSRRRCVCPYPRRAPFLLLFRVAFVPVFLGFAAGLDFDSTVFAFGLVFFEAAGFAATPLDTVSPRSADSKRGWARRTQVTETSVASKMGGGQPAAFIVLRMVWIPCPSAWASWRRERNQASAWFRQRGVTEPVRRSSSVTPTGSGPGETSSMRSRYEVKRPGSTSS
jgi:hypothetical protein